MRATRCENIYAHRRSLPVSTVLNKTLRLGAVPDHVQVDGPYTCMKKK